LSVDPIEEAIAAAIERGDFDDLPGAGKPLPRRDTGPGWWARQYVERMRAEDEERALGRELDQCLGEVWVLPDENAVRLWVETVNHEIASSSLGPLDEETILTAWRQMGRARR
jgi:hypothetical protein